MNIEYSELAISDLQRLREFIEIKSPLAAQRIAQDLIKGIDKLKIFPQLGLAVQRASDPSVIRDLYINNYTVRYLITENVIFILRVWHNKENEKNM